ncbi:MAG: hypothetical protein IPJ40_22735 [Saprospirales bacterium]|nr:hypothetical protein [Saprospirales bacterium]
MRKRNLKAAFVVMLVAFTFLFAGVQYGHAQGLATNTQPALCGPLKTSFVSSSEAQVLLEAHMVQINNLLQSLPQGSPAYQVAYRSSVYYRTVLQSVIGGKNVSNSIMDGIGMFTSTYFAGASYSEKLGLRQESINLLYTPNAPNNSTN